LKLKLKLKSKLDFYIQLNQIDLIKIIVVRLAGLAAGWAGGTGSEGWAGGRGRGVGGRYSVGVEWFLVAFS
jgi:hypothetical protein